MLNTFKVWLYSIVFALKNTPYFIKFKKLEETKKEEEIFIKLREFETYMLKKLKVKVEVVNNDLKVRTNPVLYVSNHPSMADPLFLLHAIQYPTSFFVASESEFVLKLPYIRHFYIYMRNVFIDRNNLRSGVKSIKEGTKILKSGFNLTIFPEGQITQVLTKDKIGDFKGGSFKPAFNTKVPIIPITIVGADNIQKKTGIFTPMDLKDVKIIIHKAIEYAQYKEYTPQKLAKKVELIIKKEL